MSNVLMLSAIVMLVLLFFKVPVFIAVLGGSMVYFVMNPGINTVIFAQQAIIGTEKISLMAIPFFVCAGIFMNYTGVTKRIMDFCEVVTGRLPGGLAQVNVLLSTVMGGLSGSNIADAAMESKMMVPEMTKKGFSLEFSSVVTAASSMITPLIPPGIAMISTGMITPPQLVQAMPVAHPGPVRFSASSSRNLRGPSSSRTRAASTRTVSSYPVFPSTIRRAIRRQTCPIERSSSRTPASRV